MAESDDKFIVLKEVVLLWNLAESAARSAATLGFSAMTRAFGMLLNFHKAAAGKLFDQPPHLKGEQRRRDLVGWQPAFGNDRIDGRFVITYGFAHGPLRRREVQLRSGTREIRCFWKEQTEVVKNILRACDELGALLDQAIRADGPGMVDSPRNRID